MRTVPLGQTEEFVADYDRRIFSCLSKILDVPDTLSIEVISPPLNMGGLGVASATRVRDEGSWADCIEMVQERHQSQPR